MRSDVDDWGHAWQSQSDEEIHDSQYGMMKDEVSGMLEDLLYDALHSDGTAYISDAEIDSRIVHTSHLDYYAELRQAFNECLEEIEKKMKIKLYFDGNELDAVDALDKMSA